MPTYDETEARVFDRAEASPNAAARTLERVSVNEIKEIERANARNAPAAARAREAAFRAMMQREKEREGERGALERARALPTARARVWRFGRVDSVERFSKKFCGRRRLRGDRRGMVF